MKNKKGAGHVDWTISIGIFLIFLLSILVFIKPVYKPTYESEVLGEMVKNSFLAENNRTIYRRPIIIGDCDIIDCDVIKVEINDLKENILVTNEEGDQIYKYRRNGNSPFIFFDKIRTNYWVYDSDDSVIQNNEGELDSSGTQCHCPESKIGEKTEYIGLKSSTSGTYNDLKSSIKGFPQEKDFRIIVRKSNGEELPAYTPSGNPEPPEDVSIYVYEFIYPLLEWETNQPKKTNYIVSIQIW